MFNTIHGRLWFLVAIVLVSSHVITCLVSAPPSYSLKLDGKSGWAEAECSVARSSVQGLSLEAWVYVDVWPDEDTTILRAQHHMGANRVRCRDTWELRLGLHNPGTSRRAPFVGFSLFENVFSSSRPDDEEGRPKTVVVSSSTTTLSTRTWHHIAVTVDEEFAKLYVDGILVVYEPSSESILSGMVDSKDTAASYKLGLGGNCQVDRDHNGHDHAGDADSEMDVLFDGLVDDVRVWHVTRSHAQIRQSYRGAMFGGDEEGLVVYWSMDEGHGRRCFDETGRRCHLMLKGDVVYEESVPHGSGEGGQGAVAGITRKNYSLHFDGKGSYMRIANPGYFRELTVETWFRTEYSESDFLTLFAAIDDRVSLVHFQLSDVGTSSAVTNTGGIALQSVSPRPYNHWRHAALVLKSRESAIFHNGILKDSSGKSFDYIQGSSMPYLLVGMGYGFARGFKGSIDDMRVWNVARRHSDIMRYRYITLAGDRDNDRLVGEWNFDEGKGNIAMDASIVGNDGVISGAYFDHGAPSLRRSAAYTGDTEDEVDVLNLRAVQKLSYFDFSFEPEVSAAPGFYDQSDVLVLVWEQTTDNGKNNHIGGPSVNLHLDEYETGPCSVGCVFTTNRAFTNLADAVLYQPRRYCAELSLVPPSQPERVRGQQWGVYTYQTVRAIDYLAEAKAGADFMVSYGAADVRVSMHCLNIEGVQYSEDDLLAPPPEKNDLVLFFENNCNFGGAELRFEKARELMDTIGVHSYGACLHNMDFKEGLDASQGHEWTAVIETLKSYKFYLAFESFDEPGYVTERLMLAYLAGAVPVYWGSDDVNEYVPGPKSLINAKDFDSMADLGQYLRSLDEDNAAYMEYFSWKNDGLSEEFQARLSECVTNNLNCRICERVAQGRRQSRSGTDMWEVMSFLELRKMEERMKREEKGEPVPETKADQSSDPSPTPSEPSVHIPADHITLADLREGQAIQLMDGKDFITIDHSETLNLGDSFTIALWVYCDTFLTYGNQERKGILSKQTVDKHTGAIRGYYIGFVEQYGWAKLEICINDNCAKNEVDLSSGMWYHIAFVFDQRERSHVPGIHEPLILFVVNGEQMNVGLSTTALEPNTAPMVIGKRMEHYMGYDIGSGFEGYMDNLVIFNRAIAPESIASNMYTRYSGDENSIVAFYSFDEVDGGKHVYDHSGNGNHGTVHGIARRLEASVKPNNKFYRFGRGHVEEPMDM